MLEIKAISKIYRTGSYEQKALDNVSINFRKNEFVSILGQSGSGKTTLLNIIGGLDRYTSGDLIINGVSTKEYKSSNWDTYRNHKIGFIFQAYNLIMHQSVLANVELALTISGISKSQRKKRAKEMLKKVGLTDHIHKKPNQLSGGQMQRVAIARALVNNPDIILADEPTGALDSETSVQIMNLLKEIAKEKLVIMVTHNPELAEKYSTRIVNLKDGHITGDTNPFDGNEKIENQDNKKKSSMSLLTALSLSKNNLLTKRGRTMLTAIAGSIGIIGIALILGLATGVKQYVNQLQSDSFASQAISIRSTARDDSMVASTLDFSENKEKAENDKIVAIDNISSNSVINDKIITKKNNLREFKKYIDNNKETLNKYASNIQYSYNVDLHIYDKDKNGTLTKINPINGNSATDTSFTSALNAANRLLNDSFGQMLDNSNYDLISGQFANNYNELVLIVNQDGQLDLSTMYSLNIQDRSELTQLMQKAMKGEKSEKHNIKYDYNDIIGKTYKLVIGTDYYQSIDGTWISRENDATFVENLTNSGAELKIVGIAKIKDKNISSSYLGYTKELTEYVMKKTTDTQIVKQQLSNPNINVLTGLPFDEISGTYEDTLKTLGYGEIDNPFTINIYPKDAKSKDEITKFIDKYNDNVSKENKIIFVDEMKVLTQTLTSVVNVISIVLIALVSISLIVSSIMIGIITYISVLERTKEIGILRAIGASKKDIKRVFRAETIIEGLISGLLGVGVACLLGLAANTLVKHFAKIDDILNITPITALILIAVSILLTVIAGSMPAKIASNKRPVESLKSE